MTTVASFRCASCREVAAVVKTVRTGMPVDMGPPLGHRASDADGVVVDYFGGTLWLAVPPSKLAAIDELLAGDAPDPVALRRIDWQLAPFCCTDCEVCYCHADWNPVVVMDGEFYDYTVGTCPAGHRQMLDD